MKVKISINESKEIDELTEKECRSALRGLYSLGYGQDCEECQCILRREKNLKIKRKKLREYSIKLMKIEQKRNTLDNLRTRKKFKNKLDKNFKSEKQEPTFASIINDLNVVLSRLNDVFSDTVALNQKRANANNSYILINKI